MLCRSYRGLEQRANKLLSLEFRTRRNGKESRKDEGKTEKKGRVSKTDRTKKKERQREQRRQKGRRRDRENKEDRKEEDKTERTKKIERKKAGQREQLKDDGDSRSYARLLLSAVGVWCAVPHCVSVCPSWCQRRRDGSVPTDQQAAVSQTVLVPRYVRELQLPHGVVGTADGHVHVTAQLCSARTE